MSRDEPAAGASPVADKLPAPPVEQLTRPFARFMAIESAGGIVLLSCTVAALAIANSPAAGWWDALWHTPIQFKFGDFHLAGDLGHLVINDVLMTVFFFVVGLEIKRELVTGELNDPRKAALPVAAAIGGMLAPAALYIAMMHGRSGESGWGVPMATDIAFVVGVMALLGRRVPSGLKVLLLSLAIADDIGAVIIIAAVYSTELNWMMLGLASAGLLSIYGLNRLGVRTVPIYAIVGGAIWLAVYRAGVHPTVAGVVLGLMTPTRAWVGRTALKLALTDLLGQMRAAGKEQVASHDLQLLSFAARESTSPLERLEMELHPWVVFAIMPLFALANAGVVFGIGGLSDRVAWAAAMGLFIGKPLGIIAISWLAVRIRLARMPEGVTWPMMIGAGCIAGIGFTMSLFIAGLALKGDHLAAGKIGTLLGSLLSLVIGTAVLLWASRRASSQST